MAYRAHGSRIWPLIPTRTSGLNSRPRVTGTEMEYALEVRGRAERLAAHPDKPAIINLPATVEMTTPNVFADQVEWFGRNLSARQRHTQRAHPQ